MFRSKIVVFKYHLGMKGICLVDFLLLGLGLDQVLGDCKQLLATDKTGPCYEVVPKLLKINTGRISPNILYYDPDFVSSTFSTTLLLIKSPQI